MTRRRAVPCRPPARPAGEDGSVLVLALVFLSLFGLSVAALLSFADTSFRATLGVRAQREALYAADGGVDGAINHLRGRLDEGRDPSLGFGCQVPPVPSNGTTVEVKCEGQTGSGVIVGANPANTPTKAILALGTDPTETGFLHSADAALSVKGAVFSDSTIRSAGGSSTAIAVDGDVSALGNCTGNITSTSPPLHCANTGGGADPTGGLDPGWLPAAITPPPVRTVPSCSGPDSVVTLSPGTYTDAAALSALTSGGPCAGSVFLFQPDPLGTVGVYYFDFVNVGSHVWTISDPSANLVGGTPKGWDPGSATRPAVPFPGGCTTESDPGINHGIQMIFGGDSRVSVTAGTVELCPESYTAGQQIAIYGVKTGLGPLTLHAQSGCVVLPQATAGCAFLAASGAASRLAVQGTVYAPAAALDLSLSGVSTPVLARGVVSRILVSSILPGALYTGPAIQVPSTSVRADRVVDFTACVGGAERLRATARFNDLGGLFPGQVVIVRSWSVLPAGTAGPC